MLQSYQFMPLKSGSDDSQEDNLYGSLISVASNFGEEEVIFTAGEFNRHVGGGAQDHEDLNGGYSLGFRIRKG